MAVYPTEFQAPEAYEAVDSPVFLGVDPMLLALLVALIAIAAFLGWYLGRQHAPDRHGDEALEAIHKAILKATEAALSANSGDLYPRTQTLRDRIKALLGPVIILGQGVGKRFAALELALDAQPHAPASTAPAPATPAPTSGGASTCSCGATGDGTNGEPGRCKCGAAVNQVTIIHAPVPAPPPPPPPPPSPTPPVMTREEQIDALSRAVRAFHDHWSQKDHRIGEMKAARDALGRHP